MGEENFMKFRHVISDVERLRLTAMTQAAQGAEAVVFAILVKQETQLSLRDRASTLSVEIW